MTDTPADATHIEEIKKGETIEEIPVEEKPVTTTGDVKEDDDDVEEVEEEEGEVDDLEEEGEEEGEEADMEFEEDGMVHDDAVRFYEEHGDLIEGDGDIVEIMEGEDDAEGEAEGDEEPAAKRAKTDDEQANEEDAA